MKEGASDAALVTLVYSAGKNEPIHISIKGLGGVDLTDTYVKSFDFRPDAIVEMFDARRPMYRDIAVYGQVGRVGLPWEK